MKRDNAEKKNERILKAEKHFNMKCLDSTYKPPKVNEVSPEEIAENYKNAGFDGIITNVDKL